MTKPVIAPDELDIGIDAEGRRAVAEGLANVTGPMFHTLHLIFEQQYTELALAVDLVAERIRAVGHPAPGSYAQFSRLSSIKEEAGVPRAEEMATRSRWTS